MKKMRPINMLGINRKRWISIYLTVQNSEQKTFTMTKSFFLFVFFLPLGQATTTDRTFTAVHSLYGAFLILPQCLLLPPRSTIW